ncbi:hypothetical protein EN742_00760 [Mesorhizobium sp. M4A.F.Ca.ET.020.02.1.1]|uniref:hypothetical protein n=1 Tax=Mesorhizobium sp. M4A.F.Ca.ET.020.02.1.1 TaxID=2496652 RepID=UPI000FD1CB4F|nr:hypothetical protein [Mesorhizobium sp. M4A.F.Ca.ET.020.02.1.1]RVD44909.1 hypothetical protein EN742_00760 [Mesorhizobium sp. M4A.F.Ca.ET.020.02.1.1]
MPASYFEDFKRDNGFPVTVEYSFSPGCEATYSPMYGADGGDGADAMIVACFPNTPEFNALCGRLNAINWLPRKTLRQKCTIAWLKLRIWIAGRAARLTDDERERMEIWIIEHHEYEPDYPDWEDVR